jgi:hypothetical protein
MAELTPKQHRMGLAYADRLAALAAEAPDSASKSEVFSAVTGIRKRYGWTREQKREEVIRAIGVGAAKVNEIVTETQLTRQDVEEIVGELERLGFVRIESFGNIGGRPAKHYFPVTSDLLHP